MVIVFIQIAVQTHTITLEQKILNKINRCIIIEGDKMFILEKNLGQQNKVTLEQTNKFIYRCNDKGKRVIYL